KRKPTVKKIIQIKRKSPVQKRKNKKEKQYQLLEKEQLIVVQSVVNNAKSSKKKKPSVKKSISINKRLTGTCNIG
ncbi:16665_t:CDS:1, partial [Gigaspora margarita]